MRVFILLFISFSLYAQSLRQDLGQVNMLEHLKAELRLGYIGYQVDAKDKKNFGFGGHIHFGTKSYRGWSLQGSVYGVQNIELASDFDSSGFIFLSEANLLYQSKSFMLKAGRLMFDSPHMDSDDIRMVPNYFSGVVTTFDQGEIGLEAAFIRKMAGWESGENIERFKNLNQVLGVKEQSSGAAIMGITHENFALWAYHIDAIADILYAQFDWEGKGFNLHFQVDRAKSLQSQNSIDSLSIGFFMQKCFGDITYTIGYNRELRNSQSMFSFGGGPFFTSMEEMTLDAVTAKGAEAYVYGISYQNDFLHTGILSGRFFAKNFDAREIDLYTTLQKGNINVDAVLALVDNKYGKDTTLFRVIARFGF